MAKQRANVPKFGNWENEQNDVPYTVYFNNARKNKGGKMINPNDPQENPELFAHLEPSSLAPQPKSRARAEEPIGRGAVRPAPEQRDGDLRQVNASSARNEPNYGGRGRGASVGGGGQRPARSGRTSVGSESSFERSPLHPQPHPQGNVVGRGVGSPAWEGSRSHDSSHGTPASRSRLRPARSDEIHDKGAAVPRFGEWDENDPQSAENFTHIFNKVREDRNTEGGNASSTPNRASYAPRNAPSNEAKQCCFPWW